MKTGSPRAGNRVHGGAFALLTVLFAASAAGHAEAQETEGTGDSIEATSTPVRLTLDDALRMAVGENREMERARWAVTQAREQVSEAWSNVYPSIDFTSSYTRNLSPAVSFLPAEVFDPSAEEGEFIRVQFGADNTWRGSLSLEQPLFQAQAFVGVGAAGRFEALQEESARGVSHEVVTRVRSLYYELLLQQEQAGLIQRSLERVQESLEETRALNRAGLSSDYDVLRLEVELANLEPDLRRAANEARRVQRELVTALSLPDGTELEVAGSLAEMDLADPQENSPENARLLDLMGIELSGEYAQDESAELVELARARNSTLQQAGLNTELRGAELQAERALYLPQVFLFGSYDVNAEQNGTPDFFGQGNQRAYGRSVGVRVTVPVFTGFSRDARVDQMRAQLRSSEIERDLASDQVRDQVRSLYERTEEAQLRARSQGLAVEQARRGYEIASAQYREGLSSQLELTDAEVALRQSEFNYAQAVFDYLSSRAQLDQAVGEVPLPGGF